MTSEKPETESSYGNLLIIRIKNKGQFSPIPEKNKGLNIWPRPLLVICYRLDVLPPAYLLKL